MQLIRRLPMPLQVGALALLSLLVFVSCRSSAGAPAGGAPDEADRPSWLADSSSVSPAASTAPSPAPSATAAAAANVPVLSAVEAAPVRSAQDRIDDWVASGYRVVVTSEAGDVLGDYSSYRGRLRSASRPSATETGTVVISTLRKTCTRPWGPADGITAADDTASVWTCRSGGRSVADAQHNEILALGPVSQIATLEDAAGRPATVRADGAVAEASTGPMSGAVQVEAGSETVTVTGPDGVSVTFSRAGQVIPPVSRLQRP